jgi:predicted ATPase/transcriptional regulator with XRE-family HTH domain
MDTFGEWLRQQRTERRLTREEFAQRVGCSVALLRKIEDGERRPSVQIAELIANCLDIPPAERDTFVRVARGELGASRLSTGMPLAAATTSRSNLTVFPTPLIGRQHEVEDLSQLLSDPECRLLTLVGPGGIGKTRLAMEVATSMREAFADGAYFVPLAPVNTTRFIVPVIADAIGFSFQSASRADTKTQLISYLKEKQALLLIDNLEHLLAEPGIKLLTDLLAEAPQLKLLTTSREPLELQGEWVFEVEGLPVPESKYVEGSAQNTSVELFLQRARRAHVGFDATPEDFPAIVRICQLVDGMPLGIELAAAWVRTLTCDEIAQEIESGLDFLSGSSRDLPSRHRSMRAVFDHSWRLLSEDEQAALRHLSIFQGGFRREAVEAVAEATLFTLSALVMKSLVRRSRLTRYDLHELIRQFAADQLAGHPEEQAALQARHASYYLELFRQNAERLRSSAQQEALTELTSEMDNFRAAWDWAVAHNEFALIEPSLRMLAIFYDIRGWLQEGFDSLGRTITALEAVHGHTPSTRQNQLALGHFLAARALLASRMGQYQQAQVMLERSLEILRPLDEPGVLVEPVTFLGMAMELTGNYPRASELYSEGLEIARAIGDRWFTALCLTCMTGLTGLTYKTLSPESAYAGFQSVVSDWREIGDPRLTALGLNMLSWSASTLGQYDAARLALEESVILCQSIGDRWGLGFAYRGLGNIAQVQGEHHLALEMFNKSLDTLTELGARQDVARVLAEMSRSFFALGNYAEADRNWRKSLRIATETRGLFIALEALLGLANLRGLKGNLAGAYELSWLALNHPGSIQDTKDRAAHLCRDLEMQLTGQQVEEALQRAKSNSFDAVVDEMLKEEY